MNIKKHINKNINLAVIGLGYVGLPLAVEFSKFRPVLGFDIKKDRIKELKTGVDHTLEVTNEELRAAKNLAFTDDLKELKQCNCFIITVPTPVTIHKKPDLTPLIKASESIASILKDGDIVIYESTVYPGATEEVCVPILESGSNLFFNINFFVGYSPERVNPGDKDHRIANIRKITSGSTKKIAKVVDDLYSEIILVGTHMAESIRVAEAAKVIENTQRDINIALINELAIIFNRMNIDTEAVLEAAGTKWNFLPFRPGLVGGHCIGVDPYYLTYKAEMLNYRPEIILAGRRLNDNMGIYVANQLIKVMINRKNKIKNSRILIMGLTFKENCPDLRNSRVIDIINELKTFDCHVDVYDPLASLEEAKAEYGLNLISKPKSNYYDAIVLAVSHAKFKDMGIKKIRSFGKKNHIIYDLKYIFTAKDVDLRL